MPVPVTHSSDCQREEEEGLRKVEALEPHSSAAHGELLANLGAVTSQPQTRSPPLSLSNSTDHSLLEQKTSNPSPKVQKMKSGTNNDILSSNLISISNSQKPLRKLQPHPSINSHGSKRSKTSSKSSSSQIPKEVQQDCCVHCILTCLFCEFLALCNIVLDCVTCGSCTSDESCLCCCSSGECADCDLPCDLDCGIVDACCESADCLEICMECCGLCFSS
ncbi:myoD family inhibitor isoform X2 [Microcaecilia unicolor]|nr:myoD family inhibitor isoform X2 [Microcaecilia unicolor]